MEINTAVIDPYNTGSLLPHVLETPRRPIACPEPRSRDFHNPALFGHCRRSFVPYNGAGVVTLGRASKGGEEPAVRSHFPNCLTQLRDPYEAWPVPPATRCFPPALESIRRPSREIK